MELDLRLWLMILGPIFIGVILLQGYFRVRDKKGEDIQLSLDNNYKSSLGENDDFDELSLLKAELPNGGARIVPPPEQSSLSLDVPELAEPVTVQKVAKPRKRTKKAREIPMLMEVADNQNIDESPVQTSLSLDLLMEESPSDFKIIPELKQEFDPGLTMPSEPEVEPDASFAMPSEPDQVPAPSFTMPSEPDQEPVSGFTISSEPEQEPAPSFTMPSEPDQEPVSGFTISSEPEQEPAPSFTKPSEPDTEVKVARNVDYSTSEKLVIVFVMAKQGNFSGKELRQVLQDHDMEHGDMKIFHRLSREGLSEFSLSSAVEPGFFDIAGMDILQTPGVIMFLRVHELADPMSVYGEMMKVAVGIANKLDGIVLDETRNSMTMQTIEYCRQSIRDFQFRHSA